MFGQPRHAQASEPSGPEADGGYLASASDLMIGLLFVFIILVVVLALEQRRQQGVIDAQRAGLIGAGDPLFVVTGAIGGALKKVLPNVKVDEKTGVISLPEDALFPRGSADLNATGLEVLTRAAEQLAIAMPCYVVNQRTGRDCRTNPHEHEIDTIFIEGHTDSVPFSAGGRDNFDLSLARARAVDRVLVQRTPLVAYRNRTQQPVFSFSAYADTRPRPGTKPTDAENRRVDLRIVLGYQPIERLIPGLMPTRAPEPQP